MATEKPVEKVSGEEDAEAKQKNRIAKNIAMASGFMMMAQTMCVPTRAPMILAIKKGDAAATARTMGLMSMCAALVELVLNPVLGKLSDEYGRRPFMMLAPAVNAFLHLCVSAFPTSLAMQFVDRMISGMMIFGFAAPAQAAMADLFASDPAKLGIMSSQAAAWFGVGCTVGPFLGAKMGGARSFAASGLAFLGTVLFVSTLTRETLTAEARKKFNYADINPVAFLKLFKDKTTSLLTCTMTLQSAGDYVNVYDINNLFMIKVLGYGQQQIGKFAMTVGLTQIAGGILSGRLIKATSLKFSTAFSNVMWILGMAMMDTARNTQQAFLALAIWTFGHQRATPVSSYLQKYAAQHGLGRAEIVGAQGNLAAYFKVMIPLMYSNIFAWATSNGRNIPGLPYFTICAITALSQLTFQSAAPED